MRGTLLSPEDLPSDSDKRLVWADGTQQDLFSPNADELWQWMSTRILAYARVSVEVPALMGVFLDFENYAPRSQFNAYPLSYDTAILAQFGQAQGIVVPELPHQERKCWLEQHGHHGAFTEFPGAVLAPTLQTTAPVGGRDQPQIAVPHLPGAGDVLH